VWSLFVPKGSSSAWLPVFPAVTVTFVVYFVTCWDKPLLAADVCVVPGSFVFGLNVGCGGTLLLLWWQPLVHVYSMWSQDTMRPKASTCHHQSVGVAVVSSGLPLNHGHSVSLFMCWEERGGAPWCTTECTVAVVVATQSITCCVCQQHLLPTAPVLLWWQLHGPCIQYVESGHHVTNTQQAHATTNLLGLQWCPLWFACNHACVFQQYTPTISMSSLAIVSACVPRVHLAWMRLMLRRCSCCGPVCWVLICLDVVGIVGLGVYCTKEALLIWRWQSFRRLIHL
jgi:hypothetical protein